MTRVSKRPNGAHQRCNERVMRCRRQEKRQGRGVEALEEVFNGQGETGPENLGPQPQSNIVYYFIDLRRPQEEARNAERDSAGSRWLEVYH